MSAQDATVLAELRQEKRRAREAGDEGRLAELEEMTAALLTAAGDESRARRCLERAVRHRLAVGDERLAAKARYGLALLDARSPATASQSYQGFEQALEGFRAVGDHTMAGRTQLRLAGLHLTAGRFTDASAACRSAADAFASADDVDARVEALRLGAYATQLAGDVRDAMEQLTAAVAATPSSEQALAIRLDSTALGLTAPGPGELDQMLDRAGDGSLRGMVLVLRAGERAAAGALDEAQADAEEARRIALAGPDPALYLQACLQIAGIRQLAGDRAGQLTILFTCQASLADLLGDEARAPVLLIIDRLRQQWGDDTFEREMARYRAQFDAGPS